ncbi:TonB-dependent receptor plug domain-containing protein [Novosphingobium resinovorum]
MTLRRQTRTLLTTTALSVAVFGSPVHAQDLSPAAFDGAGAESAGEAIVVTGSRIRRALNSDAAPVLEVGQQQILDRGYVSVADALNDLPSNVPTLNQADGSGASSGSGIQAPNLFGLGAGRTLTLLNGRRMVTSSSGIGGTDGVGDAQVDSNILPLGLLERVEVYQGGGAAVYGSDAIAGTVNYILKKDFTGIVLDGQTGISDRGDYGTYSLRGTAGFNFAEGRGNFAVDVGWSKSPSLRFSDRPLSNLGRLTVSNSADTGPTDGIPSVKEIFNAGFWPFNGNGVIFTAPAPPPSFLLRNGAGSALQFGSDGSVIPYAPAPSRGSPSPLTARASLIRNLRACAPASSA